MTDKNPDDLGALWIDHKGGKVAMTGTILGQKVVVFVNQYKEPGDKKPDYRVYKSKPLPARPTSARQDDSDDIPF